MCVCEGHVDLVEIVEEGGVGVCLGESQLLFLLHRRHSEDAAGVRVRMLHWVDGRAAAFQ